MRYASAGAFRTALEQRLLTMARESAVPVMRLRKLVVFDRLLARLVVVGPDRWVLKGGVALCLRLGMRARTTKDMDLGRQDDEQAATADFIAAQALDLGDHFQFQIEKAAQLESLLEGAAVRYHVRAALAGRPFDEVTVDIGFGDPSLSFPEMLRGSDLLSFAEIPPIDVPTLPLDQHVAEKVHAYTRSYAGDRLSSRTKDLVDLVLMAGEHSFDAERLRAALYATFQTRNTHPLPASLPLPPSGWGPAYRRMAADLGLQTDMVLGHGDAARLIDPVLGGLIPDAAHWDPARQIWLPSEG